MQTLGEQLRAGESATSFGNCGALSVNCRRLASWKGPCAQENVSQACRGHPPSAGATGRARGGAQSGAAGVPRGSRGRRRRTHPGSPPRRRDRGRVGRWAGGRRAGVRALPPPGGRGGATRAAPCTRGRCSRGRGGPCARGPGRVRPSHARTRGDPALLPLVRIFIHPCFHSTQDEPALGVDTGDTMVASQPEPDQAERTPRGPGGSLPEEVTGGRRGTLQAEDTVTAKALR